MEHPNEDIDILAIDVTTVIQKLPNHRVKWADYEQFIDRKKLREEDVSQG